MVRDIRAGEGIKIVSCTSSSQIALAIWISIQIIKYVIFLALFIFYEDEWYTPGQPLE